MHWSVGKSAECRVLSTEFFEFVGFVEFFGLIASLGSCRMLQSH